MTPHLTEVRMMPMIKTLIGLGAGVAAIAAAAPVSAQYYSGSRYSQSYGYSQPYPRSYGYGQYAQPNAYAVNTGVATQQFTAAVQNRLFNRSSLGGILGTLLGANTRGQVLSITQVNPRGNGTVRVRGLATSGRYASNGYGQYGVGAYGALGYEIGRASCRERG